MFGINGAELLVILLVAAVVLGPSGIQQALQGFKQAIAWGKSVSAGLREASASKPETPLPDALFPDAPLPGALGQDSPGTAAQGQATQGKETQGKETQGKETQGKENQGKAIQELAALLPEGWENLDLRELDPRQVLRRAIREEVDAWMKQSGAQRKGTNSYGKRH